jgi:hypothetical protein
MQASPKKRGRPAKAKAVAIEKLPEDVVDAGFVNAPTLITATRTKKPAPFHAMGFFKEGGLYYWAHVVVDDGKAVELERGPGDLMAHARDDFKIQVAKKIFAKEFE